MGLTRPKIWDLDTNIEYFTDPMLVLHTGSVTTANVDVGIVFNRAHGLVPNVAWYWSETLQSMVAALTPTGNTYVSQYNYSNVSVSSYANVTIGNVIANTAVYSPAYFYANGTPFNYGNVQVLANLASTGNPVTIGSNLTVNGNLTVVGNITSVNYDTINYTETANVLNANVLTVSGVNIISNVSSLQNQITGANTNISAIQANIGAYQLYSNANIGAYQLYSNANVGSIFNTVTTHTTWLGNLQANVYANANVVAYLGNNPITVGGNLTTSGNLVAASINNTIIGNTGPVAGTFSTLAVNSTNIGLGSRTSPGPGAVSIGYSTSNNGQGPNSVAIGYNISQAGTQGSYSVAIGVNAGGFLQTGQSAVAIGNQAGFNQTASNAIAIGYNAGYWQSASSIVLNATGNNLNGNVPGFFVAPVRNDATTANIGNVVMYNTTTNEFTYSNAIAIAGTLATSGNITVGGNLVANSNVASTSNVTGALVVIGGVGVTGSIYSNSLYTNGLFWAGNGQVISTGGGTSGVSGSTNTSIYSSVSKVTTTTTLIDSFVASGDIFVKWIITSIDNVNKNYAACTIDSVNDYFNVYYTEYADIRSNSLSSVASFTSNITAGNINLWATGISSNVTVSAERIVLGSATPSGYLNQNVRSNPTVYESQSIVGATVTLVDTIPIINNTFIKWITASKDYVNNNYKGSTIDTVNDGTNLYYVESGVLKNNVTANIVTFTSNVVAGNVNLWAIGDSALVNIAFERIILGASTTNGYFFNSSSTLNPTDYTGKTNVTTTPTLVDTVPVFGNTFVRWSVVNKDNVNSYYSSSTIDSVNDGGNVYYTEYDVIRSVSTQSVATFTSNITAGNINLWAVGGSSSITTSFQRTILGNSTVSGYPYSNSPYASSWNGGIVGNPIESTSTVAILNSTSSTSYKSGALVVSGGTGIGGNLSVGGNLIISGNTTSANVFSSGYFYSNGAPFATSNYGNVQMLANLAVSNVAVSGISINGVGILSSTEVYDLDDISAYTDGITNTFIPTYNGSAVTITNAWNLDIFVNGVKQPAFKYNSDLVWGGYALTASKGYCIDYSGNVRFADALPATSQVSITTKLGTNTQTTKTYPFKPLDIMLGS